MLDSTVRAELDRLGRCLFQTVGVSMEPLLHNRKSSVLLEKPQRPLACGDVVLFFRENGALVLHRIVAVRTSHYLICGDNTIDLEPVAKDHVLGLMTGYYPDLTDRFIECGQPVGRLFMLRWYVRFLIRRLPHVIARAFYHSRLVRRIIPADKLEKCKQLWHRLLDRRYR